MRQKVSPKQRKALETKMGKVFEENIKMLSKEMQETLLDDLVTAFLNRMEVLSRVRNSGIESNLTIQWSDDTLELIHNHA